jgi:flagellar biosynthesis protein FliP
MDRFLIGRTVSVVIGAAVLFELQRGFNVALYIAIPIAIVAYLVAKVAVRLLLGIDKTT